MSMIARKRGRPRTLDRDVGLGVAAQLFWRHGYEGTSIADLTKAMGVTPPSLYAAFGSKDELYRQALDHQAARENKRGLEALQGERTAYDAIALYLSDAAQRFTDPARPRGCMVSTAVLHHAQEHEEVAQAVAARREGAVQMFRKRFEHAIIEGELPADADADALARFYAAVVQGMSAQACDGADSATLTRIADIALTAWPAKPN